MTDLLDLLRDADPVDADTIQVPDHLRARVLAATPARRPRWTRAPLRVSVGLAVAAAAIVGLLLLGGGEGPAPSLAARAYAATAPRGILHWRTEMHNFVNGEDQEHTRVEGWSRKGVTHTTFSRVRRGKARPIFDTRAVAGGQTRTYDGSSDDYEIYRTPKRHSPNPLGFGEDPFAAFRDAFKKGKLKRVGRNRFSVRLGNSSGAPTAVYDIDPKTALPTSLTTTSRTSEAGRTYDSRFVMRFVVYERLPYNESTRGTLRLLPHPGAGPKNEPATAHFAVLQTGEQPTAAALADIRRFASDNPKRRLDPDGARVLSPGHFLLPGNGYVCLVSRSPGSGLAGGGFGGGCSSVAHVLRRGIASSGGRFVGGKYVRTPTTIVVPDGVSRLRLHIRGGITKRVAVRANHATVTGQTFAWDLLR